MLPGNRILLEKGIRYLRTVRGVERINMALARGQASRMARRVDPTNPATWEFTGFSQNGEDGILEFLLEHVKMPNRYFIEIGSSNGLENNTSWLSLVHRYSGLWIEADRVIADQAAELFGPLNHGVQFSNVAVTPDNAPQVLGRALHKNPDVMSVDIDSYDYFVAKAALAAGVRPRIFVVEYNSAFGPEKSVAVPYSAESAPGISRVDRLHYGASIKSWKELFTRAGYEFVAVERNGVNAFFIDSNEFATGFSASLNGLAFAENYAQLVDWPGGWQEQWELIKTRPLEQIGLTDE